MARISLVAKEDAVLSWVRKLVSWAHMAWGTRVPGVLVRPPVGVVGQLVKDHLNLIAQLQIAQQQLGALPQPALVGLHRFQVVLVPVEIRLPCLVAAVQVLQGPGKGGIQFAFVPELP